MPAAKPYWRTDRPLEGFYTTTLAAQPDRPVRTFLPTDYQPDYAYPLVVLLHGTGAGEEDAARLAPQLSRRNYICVAPRGSVALPAQIDGRAAFGWGDATAEDVRTVIEQTRRAYTIHAGRVYLLGVGDGADAAYRAAVALGDRVAGVVALNGRLPVRPAGLKGLRVLVGHGVANPVVATSAAQDDARRLTRAGAAVRFLTYPTTNRLHPDMLRDVNRWIMSEIVADADAPMKD